MINIEYQECPECDSEQINCCMVMRDGIVYKKYECFNGHKWEAKATLEEKEQWQ